MNEQLITWREKLVSILTRQNLPREAYEHRDGHLKRVTLYIEKRLHRNKSTLTESMSSPKYC